MSLPQPTENQSYCVVSALEAGEVLLNHTMFIDNATSAELHRTPCLSFLLQHTINKKRLVFDLGVRKDWNNFPPIVIKWIQNLYNTDVQQDVIDSLAKGGLSPLDIDTVCLSHIHFDHRGYSPPFARSEFVVGGDTPKLFEREGFWPQNLDSSFTTDILPAERTRFLGDETKWEQIGPFPRAYDFYGDGSLYIIDAPGHCYGHVNLLARTSADGAWIYLAGDTAHHWNLITGESNIACGPPGLPPGETAHQSKESAEQTIKRVRELVRIPRVRVLLAHDKPWYDDNKGGPAFFPGTIPSL